jgi:hypothetical protein
VAGGWGGGGGSFGAAFRRVERRQEIQSYLRHLFDVADQAYRDTVALGVDVFAKTVLAAKAVVEDYFAVRAGESFGRPFFAVGFPPFDDKPWRYEAIFSIFGAIANFVIAKKPGAASAGLLYLMDHHFGHSLCED